SVDVARFCGAYSASRGRARRSLPSRSSHRNVDNHERLAMHPRIDVPLTAADSATITIWRRRTIGVLALVGITLVAVSMLQQRPAPTAGDSVTEARLPPPK